MLKRTPKRNQDPVLWLEFFSSPESYQFFHDTLSPILFFSAQHTIRYRKGSCCGRFETEHPKRYQNFFLIPINGTTSTPSFFYGIPPGVGQLYTLLENLEGAVKLSFSQLSFQSNSCFLDLILLRLCFITVSLCLKFVRNKINSVRKLIFYE